MKKKPASLEAIMAGGGEDPAPISSGAAPLAKDKTVEKLTVYVPRAAAKCLKQMALDNDLRVNDYLREAVDMVLQKHGQPSLQDFERGRR